MNDMAIKIEKVNDENRKREFWKPPSVMTMLTM